MPVASRARLGLGSPRPELFEARTLTHLVPYPHQPYQPRSRYAKAGTGNFSERAGARPLTEGCGDCGGAAPANGYLLEGESNRRCARLVRDAEGERRVLGLD